MVASKFLNLSTDNTLGGDSPSDETVSSQKAIKEYIDNKGVDIDELSITKNSDNKIQTEGIINQNDTTEAFKKWVGTRAEFDAIENKDSHTHYICKDDNASVNIKSFRNVGDIFFTSRLDTFLNGAVECNGGEYNLLDYANGANSVKKLLESGKLPYVDFTTYASIIASKGSCRAWAYDNDHTTFKVPTLTDVYIEAGTASSAGEFIDESLPNITGSITNVAITTAPPTTGSLSVTDVTSQPMYGSATVARNWKVNLNANNSSSTYQDGAKVHPDSVKYRAMVQLYTQTTDEAIADLQNTVIQMQNVLARMTQTETTVSGFDNRMTQTETTVSGFDNRITTNTNNISSLNSRMAQNFKWTAFTLASGANANHSFSVTNKTGKPFMCIISGDQNPTTASSWNRVILQKNGTTICQQIGVATSSSQNLPFCLTYLDTAVTKGTTYTYNFRIEQASGTAVYGEEGGDLSAPRCSVYEV